MIVPDALVLGRIDPSELVKDAVRNFNAPNVFLQGTWISEQADAQKITEIFTSHAAQVV